MFLLGELEEEIEIHDILQMSLFHDEFIGSEFVWTR